MTDIMDESENVAFQNNLYDPNDVIEKMQEDMYNP